MSGPPRSARVPASLLPRRHLLPVDPRTTPFVYKYLDLADRFVRIRVAGAADVGIHAQDDLGRTGYRRAVIAACVQGFESATVERLVELYPEHPGDAEELLYQMVVSVNPGLDIRAVSLHSEQARPTTAAQPRTGTAHEGQRTDLRRKARGLARRLGERVFGQDEAVERVAQAVRRGASGLRPRRGPLAALMFVGPTGTGKTELARELARELGGENSLLRIDCGELGLAHETSRLVGAPPGYVGFEQGGQLTEGMLQRPRAVVLFDEVEKAHPRLHDMLLALLEEGELIDSQGRAVSFRDCIVILTSNAGARDVEAAAAPVGFTAEGLGHGARQELADRALRATFKPEFLGRLDEVVQFQALSSAVVEQIARRELADLACRVRAAGQRITWTEPVATWMAEQSQRGGGGARGITRVLRREVEAPLADHLLEVTEGERAWFRISIRNGRPRIQQDQP